MARSGEPYSSVFLRLDLDEHQRIALPANQVHFTGARRHAVVAVNNDDPGALQKTLGQVLTAPAESMILGHVPPTSVLPEQVGEFAEALHSTIGACSRQSSQQCNRLGW